MAARPIDAAEGYRLYRRSGGDVELDEINEHLRGLELRPVSPRMLVHYQRLFRHGYDSYVPINRLDIALAGEDAWSEELQARYPEIAQAVDGEAIWQARTRPVAIESIGVSTATVLGAEIPPAGAPVVLRMIASGIERSGSVTRSDPKSGRFHVAFDPYTSVPLAPADSLFTAWLRFELPPGAENLAAVADVFLSLDRFLVRADPDRSSLTRVRQFSMSSPIEVLISGHEILLAALGVASAVVLLRKQWYEGTKTKYEAEGVKLDNEQRRASAQLEADAELGRALSDEVDQAEAPLLESVARPQLPVGEPDSAERRQLNEAAQAAIDLPIETQITPQPDLTGDDGPN
jgi:hypothetical protein